MALLDLQGQVLGVPLYKLLGGRDAPPPGGDRGVRLKFVIGAVEPSKAAERARGMVQRGWRAIKVKVGRDPRADVERLRAVREAIGPDVFLSVDANGGYSMDEAVWVASRFEKLEVALSSSRPGAAIMRRWRKFAIVPAFPSWRMRASSRPTMRWR